MAQKRVKFVTTTGRCQYPYLTKPDTQFDAEGVYKVNLIVDDCQVLLDTCKQLAEEEFGKKDKYRLPITKDEDSGEHLIKVKSKYAPKFFDSNGQIMVGKQVPDLWAGSIVRIGGTINVYTVSGQKGVSLQLNKVQVIEPVDASTSQDSEGFDSVEGGFVVSEVTEDEDTFDAKEEAETKEAADRF